MAAARAAPARARAAPAAAAAAARRRRARCAAGGGGAVVAAEAADAPAGVRDPRVVVLGGSGRIGSKAAAALAAHLPEARVTLASRNADAAERAAAALRSGGAQHVSSASADVRDTSSVLRAIAGADLVINAAGPFQRAEQCNALEAAIASKVAYLDISDDAAYSRRAKQYASAAEAAGVPCITAAGLYPGLSNLLAAHMQAEAEREALEDGASPEDAALAAVPERLRFSYWTAGSGGAGRTILATSLMLLGEDVEAYEEGKELSLAPMSGSRVADFGPKVGKRRVYLLNLPEVDSAREVLGARTVSARFATSPLFWNWGMELVASLAPRSLLNDRGAMDKLAGVLEPLVRFFDDKVGEDTAMRVDMDTVGGRKVVSVVAHKHLTDSAATAVAAFASSMLAGGTAPGVWYPEEEGACAAGDARAALIAACAEGSFVNEVNVGQWTMETKEVQLGMGLYIDEDMFR